MQVVDVEVTETSRGARLAATIVAEDPRLPAERVEIVYRGTRAEAVDTPGDAFAAVALAPSVMLGERLTIDAPVSASLTGNMRAINRVWKDWFPRAQLIDIDAPEADRSTLRPQRISASFTGGVDSFFTAVRPREEAIDTLITVLGIVGPGLPSLEPLMVRLAAAASALSMRHLVVETNSFVFATRVVPQSLHIGATLAAPVLGLGGEFRRHFIASGPPLHRLLPSGTHPATDPFWSTEALEFVHDGVEFNKVDKTFAIAHCQVVLDHLNVCQATRPSADNCGRCNKCQLTALVLQTAGTLERCKTLRPVTPSTLRRTQLGVYLENFRDLRDRLDDPALQRAIDHAARRALLRRRIRPLARRVVRPFRRRRWRRWRRSLAPWQTGARRRVRR